MKKIINTLSETVLIMGIAAVLLQGLKEALRHGIVPAIIVFVIVWVFIFFKDNNNKPKCA